MALKPADSFSPAEIRKKLKTVIAEMGPDALVREQRELEARVLAQLKRLEKTPLFLEARTVSLYAAARGEVDVRFLERYFGERGARVVYPRLNERMIEFCAARFDELQAGPFGIFAPSPSQAVVPIEEIELAVFPGRAFGKKGERLGSGKGYYDRTFARYPGIPRFSFAFGYQVFETLPQFEWDLSMDWMVSLLHEYRSERI